jgi:uncharacterized protein (TIGR02646 family)
MIKLEKDTTAIPRSLIPAFPDLFLGHAIIPQPSRTTHQKRMNIINGETYIDKDEYNERYKNKDIRIALKEIYKNKCAFCEQKIEQYQVEHYRPKRTYYWLAFSWDNLIMACPTCNQSKGLNFELEGHQVEFTNTEFNIRNINSCSESYDLVEEPKMVNPEITNPLGLIQFRRDGLIESKNVRFAYTIEKCKIDRNYLNDERRKLLDVFSRDIRSALIENEKTSDQKDEISAIVRKFIRDSQDIELQFLAFRRFAISSSWLNEIIKEMN